MASLNPHIEENEKEFLFEQYYQNFINGLIIFKNLLKENYFESLDEEKLVTIASLMKEFIDVIVLYLNKMKRKMVEDSNIQVKDSKTLKELEIDFQEIHKQMDELENVSYRRLTELREKNDKLNILEHHIDNLTKENEEIQNKITQREFNLLEQDSIILSYEKNLKEKEVLLQKKSQLLETSKNKSDQLNQQIEEALKKLLEQESEINKFEILSNDVEHKLKGQDAQMKIKREALEKIMKEYQEKEQKQILQKKEAERLDKMIEEYQQKLLVFPQLL